MALSRQSLRAVTARDLGSSFLADVFFVTMIVSAGVFTLVDFYFHFAGLQPAFEEAQQQAAAAGGHYASEAQATPRVDVGDPPEASGFHLCVRLSCLPLCVLSVPSRRGRVLFWHVGVNRVHSSVGWMRQFRQQACERCGTGSMRVQVTGPGRVLSCHCLQLWL